MEKGIIFNIQKMSIHDGPGIRTTVFFKGCPLKCLWCANPESQRIQRDIACFWGRCVQCGYCAQICPVQAVSGADQMFAIDREKCTGCMKCVNECCTNAKKLVGQEYTVSELMEEIVKDKEFYDRSGGGVTFSGGEPLVQYKFLMECLIECKKREIHTAIETTGYTEEEKIKAVGEYLDIIHFDLKHMDPGKHRELTGVSNERILTNFRILTTFHRNVIARIPVIPGCNDEPENIRKTAGYAAECGARRLELLPYHQLGVNKYRQLGREYELSACQTPDKGYMDRLLEIASEEAARRNMECLVLSSD